MGLEINLLVPDLWQQEAVRALQNGQDVVVHAPTGAGKTYIFELFHPSRRALWLTTSLRNGAPAAGMSESRLVI